jgi:hypothetical protein
MNRIPSTVQVDTNPITLRLPAGSTIVAVRGEVWITQERRLEDFVIAAGQRFDVRRRHPLVISATHASADLFVAPPAAARRHAIEDVYGEARCRAARLRREDIARLAHAVGAGVRALLLRLRAAVSVRQRASAA